MEILFVHGCADIHEIVVISRVYTAHKFGILIRLSFLIRILQRGRVSTVLLEPIAIDSDRGEISPVRDCACEINGLFLESGNRDGLFLGKRRKALARICFAVIQIGSKPDTITIVCADRYGWPAKVDLSQFARADAETGRRYFCCAWY